jgi:hypothetical protein
MGRVHVRRGSGRKAKSFSGKKYACKTENQTESEYYSLVDKSRRILTPIYRHSIHFKDNILWLTENRINNIYPQYDSYEYTMYVYCNL